MVESRSLELIQGLVSQGYYKQALKEVQRKKKLRAPSKEPSIKLQLLECDIFLGLGFYKDAEECAEWVIGKSQNIDDPFIKIDAIIIKADSLVYQGKISKSLNAIEECEKILRTIPRRDKFSKKREVFIQGIKGHNYWRQGELDKAIDSFQNGYEISKEINDKYCLLLSILNIGWTFNLKGNLNQAMDYFSRALKDAEEIGSKRSIISALISMAEIFRHRGEVEKSMECNEASLALAKELGINHCIVISLHNIGMIHNRKGNLDQALKYYKKSLTIAEEIGTMFAASETLFHLIILAIDQNSIKDTTKYLHYLQEIDEQKESKIISQRFRVAEAMVLKTRTKSRYRGKAEEIFEKIIEEVIIDHELTIIAMLNLCELYIDDIKAYGDVEVFNDAKRLVERLYKLAQTQQSASLIVDTLILQAKFSMIEGNLSKSEELLDKARFTAEEKGIKKLTNNVVAEKRKLKQQYGIWERLIQSNAPFQARLEQAQLTDYLREAKKLLSIDE